MRDFVIWKRLHQSCICLFNFRKPEFEHFDCIDFIVNNKPLFLLSWKLANGYKVRLMPLKQSYHTTSGAAVIKLKKRISLIKVISSNCWRSTSLIIPLTHIELDDKAASQLIESLKPFSEFHTNIRVELAHEKINLNKEAPKIKKSALTVKKTSLRVKALSRPDSRKLQYPYL